MRIPPELLRAAHQSHRDNMPWSDFFSQHAEAIRKVEPFDRVRYHRLVGQLMHHVLTGEVSGQYPAGDDDAAEPWLADDQPTISDTETHARFDAARAGLGR